MLDSNASVQLLFRVLDNSFCSAVELGSFVRLVLFCNPLESSKAIIVSEAYACLLSTSLASFLQMLLGMNGASRTGSELCRIARRELWNRLAEHGLYH